MATQMNNISVLPKPRSFLAVLVLLSLVGMVLLLLATPWGPGLREDSFSYITAAESLHNGTGLGRWAADGTFRPLTHFPPLLPLMLAGLRWLGLQFVEAAKLLNIILFGVFSFLVGISAFTLTGSKIYALLSVAMSNLSSVFLSTFSWAHSEPLYLTLTLICLITLAAYMRFPVRFGYLLTATVMAALSFLTRFAGIALIVASALTMVLYPWGNLKRRVKSSMLFMGLSLAPTLGFIIRNSFLYGTPVDRPMPQWHPPPSATWLQGADTVLAWFLPYRLFSSMPETSILIIGFFLLLSILTGLAIVSYRVFRSFINANRPSRELWFLTFMNLLIYIGLILVTVLFLDRLTPLNDRILSPVFLLIFLLFIASVGLLLSDKRPPRVNLPIRVLVVGFLVLFLYRGIQTIRSQREFGLGLSTPQWQASETMEYLRLLRPIPIYTNDIPAIYFHADRMAHFIPIKQNPAEGTTRQDYPGELLEMRKALDDQNGILILFGKNPETRLHSADLSDLIDGLEEVASFEDAIIFQNSTSE